MGKSKKSKKMRKLTKVFLLIVSILIALIVVLAALVLAPQSIHDDIAISSKDSFVVSKYLFSCMNTANKSTSPMQRETIKIKSDEVMSLVRASLNAETYVAMFSMAPYEKKINFDVNTQQIRYQDNTFQFTQVLTKPFLNLVVKVQVKANAELSNGALKVNIVSIKIGRISMPQSIIKQINQQADAKVNKEIKDINQYIKYIKFEDNGDITLTYVPYEIKKIIKGL